MLCFGIMVAMLLCFVSLEMTTPIPLWSYYKDVDYIQTDGQCSRRYKCGESLTDYVFNRGERCQLIGVSNDC